MKPCRLKIITAYINPNEKERDKEIIHYVSKNERILPENQEEYNNLNTKLKKNEIDEEEEKNINIDEQKDKEEEEEAVIIRDKNDLKKKKKINKEKVYLIDGLFTSTHNINIKNLNLFQSKLNKEKDSKKLRSAKNNNINYKQNGKKPLYTYKWDHKYDNKVNTFYNSKSKKPSNLNSPNKINSEKLFAAPENPFAFNYYKTNKEIDNNITGLYNYKKKIKELLEEEPKRIEDRNNIMKENKTKIENLLEENTKLSYEIGFEINREDELKGEIIILKNQYEILINQLGKEEIKIKQYQDIINHKSAHEKIIINKQNEIINYYNNLNECLNKGEILLVIKPDLYDRFKYFNSKNIQINNNSDNIEDNKDNKNIKNDEINLQTNLEVINEMDNNNEIDNYLNNDIINLLLKGYFINMNLKNTEEIVEKIWKYEKPIQTFEALTEEILLLIENYIDNSNSSFINEHNRTIIMNYLYSFCNCYNYMTKNEFISIFNDKLGYFIEFNENYLINKLYIYCKGKLNKFRELIINLDKKKTGIIYIHDFIKALKENNIIINDKFNDNLNLNQINEEKLIEENDIIDLMQLLIISFKKNKKLIDNDFSENKDNNIEIKNKNLNEKKRNINIYELYYETIINIINENSKSKNPLYKGIIKKYLIENNINSMIDFMEPLLLNKDIIINKGLNRYIKSQSFNDFLISKNVIEEDEIFLIPYNEESLIDINQLVVEIDQASPILNIFDENKERLINDIINDIGDN